MYMTFKTTDDVREHIKRFNIENLRVKVEGSGHSIVIWQKDLVDLIDRAGCSRLRAEFGHEEASCLIFWWIPKD